MKPVELLRKKRFGGELSEAEIREFVNGTVNGEWTDYQISAMLMAICINGMSDRETLALTLAMQKSGSTLDLSDVEGVKADKHSTGGVSDTTSLALVPLLACCGVKVAKMSGRGLDFTGGTLDKLESIPGTSVEKDVEAFNQQVRDVGCAIVGQSADLAPADKVLYALRDVTGTVDCMPLITSSILSKKLAAGCDVVILDVKYGSGAMCKTPEEAHLLAQKMVQIGCMSGHKFSALVTGMEQPLGRYIGNALEVKEAIELLNGQDVGDLKTVTLELGAHILRDGGFADTVAQGRALLQEKIDSGAGLAKLAEMIAAQGGNPEAVLHPELLPKAQKTYEVRAFGDGYLRGMKTDSLGNAARLLGAGREKKTDVIDPAVGILVKKRLGDPVRRGETLCEVYANPASDVKAALTLLNGAFEIGSEKPELPPLIRYVVEG